MVERNYSKKDVATRGIRIACSCIFIVFSICYLLYQDHLLEMLQKVLSDGQTSYSAKWGTWIITFILCLIQWGVSSLSRLPERCHALSYIPSILLLAFITDTDHNIYNEITLGEWIWALPAGAILYILLAWLCHQIHFLFNNEHERKWLERFFPNAIILYFLCLVCLFLGNTDDVFHYESATDAAILKGNYTKASSIGIDSRKTSRDLTIMRTYALSRTDSLPDKLFHYPQYDASHGLLFDNEEKKATTWLKKEIIYEYLGGIPQKEESIIDYLKRLCYTDSGNEPALDYYLCALLLRKELDVFVKELYSFCYVDSLLPEAYQEALYLYSKKDPSFKAPFKMDQLQNEYNLYKTSPNMYWRNYWYYYDHMTILYKDK